LVKIRKIQVFSDERSSNFFRHDHDDGVVSPQRASLIAAPSFNARLR
jgi:hypothetical protein